MEPEKPELTVHKLPLMPMGDRRISAAYIWFGNASGREPDLTIPVNEETLYTDSGYREFMNLVALKLPERPDLCSAIRDAVFFGECMRMKATPHNPKNSFYPRVVNTQPGVQRDRVPYNLLTDAAHLQINNGQIAVLEERMLSLQCQIEDLKTRNAQIIMELSEGGNAAKIPSLDQLWETWKPIKKFPLSFIDENGQRFTKVQGRRMPSHEFTLPMFSHLWTSTVSMPDNLTETLTKEIELQLDAFVKMSAESQSPVPAEHANDQGMRFVVRRSSGRGWNAESKADCELPHPDCVACECAADHVPNSRKFWMPVIRFEDLGDLMEFAHSAAPHEVILIETFWRPFGSPERFDGEILIHDQGYIE